jgi:hypothetical protein
VHVHVNNAAVGTWITGLGAVGFCLVAIERRFITMILQDISLE